MPSACMKSTTIHTPPPFNEPATGKVYIDYLYTDYPDRVVITSRILLSISPRISGQTSSIELYGGSTWTIYTTTYSGKPTTTHAASTTAETIGVASDLQSLTVYKTHSAINYNITAYYSGCKVKIRHTKQSTSDTMYGSVTEALPQIPAKTHYTVAYNVNGGTGGPTTSSTKWYNETLTLSATAPTRTGFKFKGWATSSTGSAVYAAGGSYTANAAATLYAVWERNTYTVTYNANGGTGAPGNQTKQYGIDLTLSNTVPTFSGYTFKGWATSQANAGNGTVTYAKGAQYTGNAALSLYAVWELTHTKPYIKTPITIERCQSNGQSDDEGQYAKITFEWSIYKNSSARYYGGSGAPYANNSVGNCTVQVGNRTQTVTLDGSSSGGTPVPVVVGVNEEFLTDSQYSVTLSITDAPDTSYSGVTALTTTVTGVLPTTYFPLDFNEDATAVGFFMPAPPSSSGNGAYFAKDVTLKEEFYIYVDDSAASGSDALIKQATDVFTTLGWTGILIS